MKRVGILANPTLAGIGPTIDHFVSLAVQKGFRVLLADTLKDVCQERHEVFCPPDELQDQAQILIAMGGDGTLLRAARLVKDVGMPILGVNLGRLGFLAGAGPEELEESLDRLLREEYDIEERMALVAQVGGRTAFALNEGVIEKGVLARLVQVKAWILDQPVSSFFGNGLIVATPTGSTGYSLSSGGPVIHPQLQALIVTPICPHSLSLRPVVVPGDQTIVVQLIAEHSDIILTADGQTVCTLAPSDRVLVQQAPEPVRLINLQGLSFYELLRRKLDWSLDRRDQKG